MRSFYLFSMIYTSFIYLFFEMKYFFAADPVAWTSPPRPPLTLHVGSYQMPFHLQGRWWIHTPNWLNLQFIFSLFLRNLLYVMHSHLILFVELLVVFQVKLLTWYELIICSLITNSMAKVFYLTSFSLCQLFFKYGNFSL